MGSPCTIYLLFGNYFGPWPAVKICFGQGLPGVYGKRWTNANGNRPAKESGLVLSLYHPLNAPVDNAISAGFLGSWVWWTHSQPKACILPFPARQMRHYLGINAADISGTFVSVYCPDKIVVSHSSPFSSSMFITARISSLGHALRPRQ